MSTTGTARVVLVEDDPAIRMVVEILLSTEPDLELVGSAVCAEDGIALVRREAPDLLLLDNQLEGPLTGVAAAPAFKDAFPGVLVLLCTALDLADVAATAEDIDGYLRKDHLVDLADTLRALLARHRR